MPPAVQPQRLLRRLTDSAARAPGDSPPHWPALAVLVVAAVVYWALNYQPYILYNTDFPRVKAMAENFMTGQMPRDFKQMPLVPLLMVPLAVLLPVAENAYLHAVSVLNIGLSAGSLVLLYFLARTFLGSTLAFVPVLLLVATPQFTISAHQPMLEPAIGFFSLATLLALARGSGWAYPLAGLCALTRYELSVVLGVVFLVETYRAPRDWLRNGLKCTVMGLPFLVWFGLSELVTPEGNPYLDEMVRSPVGAIVWNLQTPLSASRPLVLGFVVLAWTVGVYTAFRRNAPAALGVLAFMGLYTVAHIVYGRVLPRYGYAVLWVVPLLATAGVHTLFVALRPAVERLSARGETALAVLLAAAGAAWIVRSLGLVLGRIPEGPVRPPEWYLSSSALLLAALAAVALVAAGPPVRRRVLVAAAMVVMVAMPVLVGGRDLARRAANLYYEKAEFVVAERWMAENLDEDARVVMPQNFEMPGHLPHIPEERVVRYRDLPADDHAELVREMDARGLEYAVFVFRRERPADPGHPHYARAIFMYETEGIHLMEPFRSGGEVPGFELVAALPPLHPEINHPTYIYRRVPGSVFTPDGEPRPASPASPLTRTQNDG